MHLFHLAETAFLIFRDYDHVTLQSPILQVNTYGFWLPVLINYWLTLLWIFTFHQNFWFPKLDVALQVLSGPTDYSRIVLNHFITKTLFTQPQSLISCLGSCTSPLTHLVIAVNWNPQVQLKLIATIMYLHTHTHNWNFGLHIYPC